MSNNPIYLKHKPMGHEPLVFITMKVAFVGRGRFPHINLKSFKCLK